MNGSGVFFCYHHRGHADAAVAAVIDRYCCCCRCCYVVIIIFNRLTEHNSEMRNTKPYLYGSHVTVRSFNAYDHVCMCVWEVLCFLKKRATDFYIDSIGPVIRSTLCLTIETTLSLFFVVVVNLSIGYSNGSIFHFKLLSDYSLTKFLVSVKAIFHSDVIMQRHFRPNNTGSQATEIIELKNKRITRKY